MDIEYTRNLYNKNGDCIKKGVFLNINQKGCFIFKNINQLKEFHESLEDIIKDLEKERDEELDAMNYNNIQG